MSDVIVGNFNIKYRLSRWMGHGKMMDRDLGEACEHIDYLMREIQERDAKIEQFEQDTMERGELE